MEKREYFVSASSVSSFHAFKLILDRNVDSWMSR